MAGHSCKCQKNHRPQVHRFQTHHIWPRGHGGMNERINLVSLCPTTHANVHRLLDWMLGHNGKFPDDWANYGRYARQIARLGYDAITQQQIVWDTPL